MQSNTNTEKITLSAEDLEKKFSLFVNFIIDKYSAMKILYNCNVAFFNNNYIIYSDDNFILSNLVNNKKLFSECALEVLKSDVKFDFIYEIEKQKFKACSEYIKFEEIVDEKDESFASNINYLDIDEENLTEIEKTLIEKFNAKRIH